MPNLVSEDTVDTASTVGSCSYIATPIGGTPIETSVVVGNQPLKIIAGTPYQCDSVPGAPNPPCQTSTRTIQPTVNTTVYIDEELPAVTGDQTQLAVGGTPRVLTGPFQHANIIIGSNL